MPLKKYLPAEAVAALIGIVLMITGAILMHKTNKSANPKQSEFIAAIVLLVLGGILCGGMVLAAS